MSITIDHPRRARTLQSTRSPRVERRPANIILLGAGAVGRALLDQIALLAANDAPWLRVVAVVDTTGYIVNEHGLDVRDIAELARHKTGGGTLARHSHGRAATPSVALASLLSRDIPHAIVVDATAADTGSLIHDALSHGTDVVLANKIPLVGTPARYVALRHAAQHSGARLRYEATVGAGLPVIDTLRKLVDAGDSVHAIEGCPSGTLGYLFAQLGAGVPFSVALKQAMADGLTEPDPRVDLSGIDVARKALILARMLGYRGGLDDVCPESLIPPEYAQLDRDTFLNRAHELDASFATRVSRARAAGLVLRYRTRVTPRDISVGVSEVRPSDPLGRIDGTDNQFAFSTSRYHARPLVISGPGAGPSVTAAGIVSDILQLASTRRPRRRGAASPATVVAAPVTPAFEISGPPDAPIVVVLGGISAHRHVVSTPEDATPGWWEDVVGRGRAIDTTRFRVLGIDFLDGGRASDGRPLRAITTHEQADAIARTLDAIGERRAHAVVGASYGGMVALAFAERYPDRLCRLVAISAAHESHPMSTALRAMQRRIVELGLDTGRPLDALALARGVAMTTYRTAREFGERFVLAHNGDVTAPFEVEEYLDRCGRRFATSFSVERFLSLSLSADLHRVDPSAIRTPSLFVAAEGDTLIPDVQLAELATRLGAPCRLLRVPTRYGHDAFLTEPHKVGRILGAALRATLTAGSDA